MRRIFLSSVLASALLAAGCSTINTYNVEVSSYGSWPSGRLPGTYAIERLPSQQANLAQQMAIEDAARPALERAGFRLAESAAQAEVLVQVGARVTQVYSPDPFAGSFYWSSNWWYGPRGYYRGGPYWGPYWGPGWGPYGGAAYYDFPDYLREVGVLVRDQGSQQVIYETRGRLSTRNSDPNVIAPMFDAALRDFPGPALSPRVVTITLLPPAAAASAPTTTR